MNQTTEPKPKYIASKGITIFISKKEVQKVLNEEIDTKFWLELHTKILSKIRNMKCMGYEPDPKTKELFPCRSLTYKEAYCKKHWIEEIKARFGELDEGRLELIEDGLHVHLADMATEAVKQDYLKEMKRLGIKL